MKLRLPWILSRKRLITAAFLDSILFAIVYNLLFLYSFYRWPGFVWHLPILLAIWILASYVVGRYSSGDSQRKLDILMRLFQQVIGTIFVLIIMIVITLLYILVVSQSSFEAVVNSFMIPFLGLLSWVSLVVQFLLDRFIFRQQNSKNFVWSFVGKFVAFEQLEKALRWKRLPVDIVYVPASEIEIKNPVQIVVEDINTLAPDVLNKLLCLQQNGSLIFSRLNWCEEVLQRFPSDFLTFADILGGEFSMPAPTYQMRLKRSGDVILSIFLLILTSPILVICSFLIKINDSGPIFYSQLRIGFGGRPFRIWKLRTMHLNAEQAGPQWSTRSDSRITAIGSILRRTRIDELPQLWCVLIGTMSLIGPRPERPEFDDLLNQEIPHYRLRYQIRPGLSGWAQVNYPYGASVEDSSNKFSYDLYYLRNSSFLLDLLILLKTIRLVFNAKGSLPCEP